MGEERYDSDMCSSASCSLRKPHFLLKMSSLLPSVEPLSILLSKGLWQPDLYLAGHRIQQLRKKLQQKCCVLCRQNKSNHYQTCVWVRRDSYTKYELFLLPCNNYKRNVKKMDVIPKETLKAPMCKNVQRKCLWLCMKFNLGH